MNNAATVAVTAVLVAILAGLLYCLRIVMSNRWGRNNAASYAPLLNGSTFDSRRPTRQDFKQWRTVNRPFSPPINHGNFQPIKVDNADRQGDRAASEGPRLDRTQLSAIRLRPLEVETDEPLSPNLNELRSDQCVASGAWLSPIEGNTDDSCSSSASPQRFFKHTTVSQSPEESVYFKSDTASSTDIFTVDTSASVLSMPVHHASMVHRTPSSDSLSSSSSIVDLKATSADFGQLELTLCYDREKQLLTANVVQLFDVRFIAPTANYWLLIFLLPHPKPLWRSKILHFAPTLQFREQFEQCVLESDLKRLAVLCQLYCRLHENEQVLTLGFSKVRLRDLKLATPKTLLLTIAPYSAEPKEAVRGLGKILFSLVFSPSAHRLMITVLKAKNIRCESSCVPSSLMVRIYLICGSKVKRKTTSLKTVHNGAVVFNESLFFTLSQLQVEKVYLRLSVVESDASLEMATIGHVTLGSRRNSKEFGHWDQMINEPHKPITMWHELKTRIAS